MVTNSKNKPPPPGYVEESVYRTAVNALKAQLRTVRESLNHNEFVLSAIAESIVWTDEEGIIKWCNTSFDTLVGELHVLILGRPLAELLPLDCESACETRSTIQRVIESKNPIQDVCRFEKDGSVIDLELQGKSLTHPNGQKHAVFVLRDVTRRRDLERQLTQARKLESVGSLAAGIAHEINTPIHYIGENIDFIHESLEETYFPIIEAVKSNPSITTVIASMYPDIEFDYSNADIQAALAESRKGIDQVTRIVKSVKAFSHPGKTVKEQIDLNEVIISTVLLSSNEYKYVATVDTDLDHTLPTVPCLVGKLNQVLLNLIVNAAHAIEEARERYILEELGRITITTRQIENWVEIRISDTGCGIPESIHDRLFDPFFTTKDIGKGTGQGLAISHTIVKRDHGGHIYFETQEAVGTTFVILLPIQDSSTLPQSIL